MDKDTHTIHTHTDTYTTHTHTHTHQVIDARQCGGLQLPLRGGCVDEGHTRAHQLPVLVAQARLQRGEEGVGETRFPHLGLHTGLVRAHVDERLQGCRFGDGHCARPRQAALRQQRCGRQHARTVGNDTRGGKGELALRAAGAAVADEHQRLHQHAQAVHVRRRSRAAVHRRAATHPLAAHCHDFIQLRPAVERHVLPAHAPRKTQ